MIGAKSQTTDNTIVNPEQLGFEQPQLQRYEMKQGEMTSNQQITFSVLGSLHLLCSKYFLFTFMSLNSFHLSFPLVSCCRKKKTGYTHPEIPHEGGG